MQESKLTKLFDDVFTCKDCKIYRDYYEGLRKRLPQINPPFGPHVPWIKDPNRPVDVMFIGLQPGYSLQMKLIKGFRIPDNIVKHDKYGFNVAFGSHSGGVLRELIDRYFSKCNVYVTNVVKCNTIYDPTHDRAVFPPSDVIHRCRVKFLNKELLAIKPKVAVVLGNMAWDWLEFPKNADTIKNPITGIEFIKAPHPASLSPEAIIKLDNILKNLAIKLGCVE